MKQQNNWAVETEDPIICAFKYVAQILTCLHPWSSPEELGWIVGHVFDVPRGKKDE